MRSGSLETKSLQNLIPGIKAGSKDAADTFIVAHIRLARKIVQKNPSRNKEDLFGAAMLAICKMVEKIRSGEIHYYPKLAAKVIYYAAIDESYNSIIRVPPSSHHTGKAKPVIGSFEDKEVHYENDLDIIDLIETKSTSRTQRTVLLMRLEGYSDREIANSLKMSRSYIFNLRTEFGRHLNGS